MRKTNAIRLAVPLLLLLLLNSCSKKDLSAEDTSNKTSNQNDATRELVATQRALGNSEIKVVGKGFFTDITETTSFSINASRKTNGAVSGHLSYTSSFLDFIGDVNCITLVEGKLTVTGVIKQLSRNSMGSFAYIGIKYFVTFEDNGEGIGAPPDRMSYVGLGGPSGCESNTVAPNEIQGNIQIIQ